MQQSSETETAQYDVIVKEVDNLAPAFNLTITILEEDGFVTSCKYSLEQYRSGHIHPILVDKEVEIGFKVKKDAILSKIMKEVKGFISISKGVSLDKRVTVC